LPLAKPRREELVSAMDAVSARSGKNQEMAGGTGTLACVCCPCAATGHAAFHSQEWLCHAHTMAIPAMPGQPMHRGGTSLRAVREPPLRCSAGVPTRAQTRTCCTIAMQAAKHCVHDVDSQASQARVGTPALQIFFARAESGRNFLDKN
jgi:hypothetical protein